MLIPEQFPAYVVRAAGPDSIEQPVNSAVIGAASIEQLESSAMDPGDVVVRVVYSALNYKDAMASQGNPGVARKLPLVPGIDAVGDVISSEDDRFKTGDQVLISHAKFGTAHNGGFASFVRVPGDWVYPLPEGLTVKETITWGTAGFTAAQSVEQLVKHDVGTDSGEVLVTGASGGVGSFAVGLLSKLGFRVVAATGKMDKKEWLKQLGATEVVPRQQVVDTSDSALLKGRWAGVVDTVGGETLSSAIRAAKLNACVTVCGLVGGHELHLTVYPFILRGVTLCGIDSANISRETRVKLWDRIGTEWKFDLTRILKEVDFDKLPNEIENILAGQSCGRTIIKMP